MRKVCISPSNNNYIYATSSSAFTDGSYSTNSHGVYFSNDKFVTSALVNNGMTWPFAMTVKCDSLNNVYIGSPGTGFQKAHIPGLQALDGFKVKSHYSIINPEVDIYPSISVSPTVVENSITVNRQAKRILVLNLAGKVLVDKSNAIRLDMTAIKPGVYIVKVEMEDASSKTFKVVKL